MPGGALVAKLCPSRDPMDCSPPDSYSPGKNTGVGCHFLLKGIFPTQGSNLGLLHCRQILYQLSYQGRFRGHIYLSLHCVPIGNISEDESSLNSLPHSHYVTSCEDCFFSNAIHLAPDSHLDRAPSFCSAHYVSLSLPT